MASKGSWGRKYKGRGSESLEEWAVSQGHHVEATYESIGLNGSKGAMER